MMPGAAASVLPRARSTLVAEQWSAFYPAGTGVIALPDWTSPRLLIPASPRISRWGRSAWFPAFRLGGRLLRFASRARAVLANEVRVVPANAGALAEGFVKQCFPGAGIAGVLVGMPGATGKFTVALEDDRGHAVAFLKCLNGGAGAARARREAALLRRLPDEIGPRLLVHGASADFHVLAVAPLAGGRVPARLPVAVDLRALTDRLRRGERLPTAQHPWFCALRAAHPLAEPLMSGLLCLDWDVSYQHGDLAPWNLVRRDDGSLAAFDWEDGSENGLSLADHAHYVLQVGGLIHRLSPARARMTAAAWVRHVDPRLDDQQATAVVQLTALANYMRTAADGHQATDEAQRWRNEVFRGAA